MGCGGVEAGAGFAEHEPGAVVVAMAWLAAKALMLSAAIMPAMYKVILHLISLPLRKDMLSLVARQKQEVAATLRG